MAEALPTAGASSYRASAPNPNFYAPDSFHFATIHWEIKNFLLKSRSGTKTICSPEITAKSVDPDSTPWERKWQLKLIPQVYEASNRRYMAISLNLLENLEEELVLEECSTHPRFKVVPIKKDKPTKATHADFQISILDKNGEVVKRVTCNKMEQGKESCVFRPGAGWGYNHFFSLDSLWRQNLLLEKRDLVLKCEIWTRRHKDENERKLQEYRDGEVWWKDNGLGRDFGPLKKRKPNVLIYVESSGVTYPAHKKILQEASPAFVAKLKQQQRGRNGSMVIIKIPGFDKDVVHAMIEYVYWGHLDPEFAQRRAPELFQIADRYCLLELREICQKSLVQDLNENNLRQIWELAKMYQCAGLKEKCAEFMDRNQK